MDCRASLKPTEVGGASRAQNNDSSSVIPRDFDIVTPPRRGEGCGDTLDGFKITPQTQGCP